MSKYICNTQESVIQDWFIFWDNFLLLHKTSLQRLQPSYLHLQHFFIKLIASVNFPN